MFNSNKELKASFVGKTFNLNGVERECYYCSLEDGGAWFWLYRCEEDIALGYQRINFVVDSKYDLQRLRECILKKEEIEVLEYGRLSKQK